jgi:protein-S-isoprenylcysteine O-methyltransferase Ste14
LTQENSADLGNNEGLDRNLEIGERFFEYRDYTPIPLILLLLFVASPTVTSATLGTLLVIAGEFFRIYSVAFIGSISRTRSSNTGSRLIKEGPFGWFRNPLYVGNFFIVFGIATFAGIGWLVALTAILFAIQYFFIVLYEEHTLEKKFGAEYLEYKKEVPAWLPHKMIKLSDIQWPDTFSPAIKSERRTLTAIAIILFSLVMLSR